MDLFGIFPLFRSYIKYSLFFVIMPKSGCAYTSIHIISGILSICIFMDSKSFSFGSIKNVLVLSEKSFLISLLKLLSRNWSKFSNSLFFQVL